MGNAAEGGGEDRAAVKTQTNQWFVVQGLWRKGCRRHQSKRMCTQHRKRTPLSFSASGINGLYQSESHGPGTLLLTRREFPFSRGCSSRRLSQTSSNRTPARDEMDEWIYLTSTRYNDQKMQDLVRRSLLMAFLIQCRISFGIKPGRAVLAAAVTGGRQPGEVCSAFLFRESPHPSGPLHA
ncbi:hypothetical protein MJT46_009737 [Ovis ammon polii x Ovis aries]|nr:hypothetical protein MJT46_009737 [Ovis ammon polii x Ovis aries]